MLHAHKVCVVIDWVIGLIKMLVFTLLFIEQLCILAKVISGNAVLWLLIPF